MSKSPTNEQTEFLSKLLKAISGAYREFHGKRPEIKIEEHDDYWTIDFEVKFDNSKYSDCVVFYINRESFDPQKAIEDFEEIIDTAKQIQELKRR